jgi:polyisoprenyl-phosphate glycosyltransferase
MTRPEELEGKATSPKRLRLSVAVPVYNEAAGLRDFVDAVAAHGEKLDVDLELILVDDGSTDDTWGVIRALQQSRRYIRGYRLSRNFGKEAALSAGLDLARGDAVVVMDADLQHPPELIPQMVDIWRRRDVDIVEGVKILRPDEPRAFRLGASLFYWLMVKLTGQDLHGASDFKLLDRRVVEAWRSMGERNVFFRGMASWLGFTRVPVEFTVPKRRSGVSSWSLPRLVRLALTAVTAFSFKALQLVTALGVGFIAFAFILGVYTVAFWVTGRALSGFTTVILVVLLTGGTIMMALGIVGEYLARIYEEVKQRPRYVIADAVEPRD